MARELDLSMKELMSRTTIVVKVKRLHEFEWRVKLGTWLIALGARIMWCDVEFEDG